MEDFKCLRCGAEMEFIGYDTMDTNPKEGKIWIIEEWECFTCSKQEKIEISGKIAEIIRSC